MDMPSSVAFTVAAGSVNFIVFVMALSIGRGGSPWQMSVCAQPLGVVALPVIVLLRIG